MKPTQTAAVTFQPPQIDERTGLPVEFIRRVENALLRMEEVLVREEQLARHVK